MQQIEKQYTEFISEFGKHLDKVDVTFALQMMYLQRRIPDSSPKAELRVCYTPGIDLEEKRRDLDSHFACISTTQAKKLYDAPDCENTLGVECLTNLDTIFKISQDPDIISIHGRASLGSF